MNAFIDWNKKYIAWWQKKLNISDYGVLWITLIKEKKPFKKIEFKVSNESAWEVGLACGGEIAIFLEQIN